jgi:hypothetical protein
MRDARYEPLIDFETQALAREKLIARYLKLENGASL